MPDGLGGERLECMNEDMPWVIGLTDEEVQQLRNQKQQLTQYGREKLKKLMKNYLPDDDTIEEMLHTKLTDEKKEELKKMREQNIAIAKISDEDLKKVQDALKEKQVLDIAKNLMEENKEAFQHLAAIERKDLIDYALEELNAIVRGGQDTREFYRSVTYIRQVLESFK